MSAGPPRAPAALLGQNGQFRTPRHIIQLMVEMTAPSPDDVICDPACGTCGYLVAAGEYIRRHHPEALRDPKLNRHFHDGMFSANQIEFVNLLIDYLSENGVIDARRFYESPFTDLSPHGPDALFDAAEVDRLVALVNDVRRRAEAA